MNPMGDSEVRDVAEFMLKFGHARPHWLRKPGHVTKAKLLERLAMMREELREFEDAVESQSLPDLADALVDLVYFAKGTANLMGLPWQSLWDEVHKANMAKERGTTKRGFKVDAVKPEGWQPPDLLRILHIFGYVEAAANREEVYRGDHELL